MSKKMINKTFIFKLITICIEPLVKLVPRNKHKWAFGATQSFKDNPKYFFYWTNEKHPEIRSIWIAQNHEDVQLIRSQGFESYYVSSLKGLYHALTSKVYIGDHHIGDVNPYLSGGSFFVNLWHGSSVKRVRWQATDYYVRKYHLKDASEMKSSFYFRVCEYLKLFRTPNLLLAPSEIQAHEFFSPMLEVPLENCVVGVFPRSRLLLSDKAEVNGFIKKYEPQEAMIFINKLSSYNKVYIYMPTWRTGNNNFIEQAKINWGELNDVLSSKNEVLILRFHPITRISKNDFTKYDHILFYPSQKTDIYTVLPFVDCLITDYSSVYTDFLIMNKEIILFVFDYDDYIKKSHDLENYDEYYIGKRAYNYKELLNILKSGEDCHIRKDQYQHLMKYFWDCNERQIDIVEEIKNRIGI